MNRRKWPLLALLFALCAALAGCAGPEAAEDAPTQAPLDTSSFLRIVDESPDTVDPQCTPEFYTVPLNVFDRLVEVSVAPDGSTEIIPSLAEEWQISEDGLTYTFRLHEGVRFSNGAALTASDVLYTFTRLLTHPDACNQDIATAIAGAEALRSGQADTLAGFTVISDTAFSITLEKPYAAFLACLSTPGASILDEETTEAAGSRFGKDADVTIGTGPFILRELTPDVGMILEANPDCWSGAPGCAGVEAKFITDSESMRLMFEEGQLDILDLDSMSTEAEYFVHGDIYQDYLIQGPRVGIDYIALNQAVEPLHLLPVRRALQLALNRQTLLDAVCSGRGTVENGIFPHGLIGHNPDLPAIDYDPEAARALLAEAGYPDGFTLEISLLASSSRTLRELITLTASMWRRVGIDVQIREMEDDAFMSLRKSGQIACYSSTWSADFNDPDNFIYTFFGTRENTLQRSLCYPDEAVIARVRDARAIVDEDARIGEYQALERKIVQEDAAWIPLYSRQHYFVINKRVQGFQVSWNGWSSTNYRNVTIQAQ